MNIARRFAVRIIIGSLLSIWAVRKLDLYLGTSPYLMIVSLLFVIFGSMYLLVKEAEKGDK